MNHFSRLPEFEKEFLRLSKKYPSLNEDLLKFEKIIVSSPIGFGTNFVTIHHGNGVKIIKARLACRSLRERSVRMIYAYHEDRIEFMYIEIYFKGDKENEDRERIRKYLQNL